MKLLEYIYIYIYIYIYMYKLYINYIGYIFYINVYICLNVNLFSDYQRET